MGHVPKTGRQKSLPKMGRGRFTTTNNATNRKKKWTMLIGKDDVLAQTSAQHSR